ncbi:putative protein S-acyltransferase 22 [Orobanche gracilis]
MSPISSITGLSSASSLNTFHRAAWCTPPRLFAEDQQCIRLFTWEKDNNGRTNQEKESHGVKISPWTLARLNADDVSKAAEEAKKKSKILRPVRRPDPTHP